ncbi:hypothetical protein AHAS_Ahas03G0294100 [Arachis hypogaea]
MKKFKITKKSQECLIRWIPPQEQFIKLNTDRSFYSHNNNAVSEGLFRDHLSSFISTFSYNLGSCSIVHAELWGIIKDFR